MEKKSERDFYRAAAQLTVYYGPDEPEARQAMAMDRELWSTHARLEAEANRVLNQGEAADELEPLVAAMRWLDFKLDLVLYHLRSSQQGRYFPHQAPTTDLSGSGVGLAEPSRLPQGSPVLICLPLPDHPSRPVMAMGEVARGGSQADEPSAAITFTDISETDRERIVHFTFQKQRQELARRSEET